MPSVSYRGDIRRAVLTHLAVAPERELAFGLTLFSVVQEGERLGDLAKGIAKVSVLAWHPPSPDRLVPLRELRELVLSMSDDTVKGFVESDTDLARAVMQRNDDAKERTTASLTALLAALLLASSGSTFGEATLQVAFAHLCFNVFGIALIWPIRAVRRVPVRLAEKLGDLSVQNHGYAFAYIALVFFILPILIILATRNLDTSFYNPTPSDAVEVPAEAPPAPPEPL